MTSPTVIVKGPAKPNSQKHDLEVPVTPYEVTSNVDLDDPLEHSRDPKTSIPINRNPARKSVQLREKKWNPKGIHGAVRKVRFPELFNQSRYGIELIKEMEREFPEPRDMRVWINEVLASGVPEDQRDKYIITKHPGFPAYWALFELLQNPETGAHYRLVSIAMTAPKAGYLSPALFSSDQRWEHMRGEMGDPREFTKQDFIIMREQADRRLLGSLGVAKKMEEREAAEYREKDRIENDFVLDMLDYNFLALNTAANNGTKQYSVATVEPHMNPERWHIEQRNGYRVKTRRGTRLAEEMENAVREKAEKDVDAENAAKKQKAEFERQQLIKNANQITRAKAIEQKPKKTL